MMATVERAVLGRGESIFIAALNKKKNSLI